MARTGLKQPVILSSVSCANPRTQEATLWGNTRDGLESYVNNGVLLSSAWGLNLANSVHPICGGYVSGSMLLYKGTLTHESTFEQVGLATAGASTSADKYILHTRFALLNHSGTFAAGTGTLIAGTRIKYTLSSTGGSQELYSVKSQAVVTSAIETKTVSGDYQIYEQIVTGTLTNTPPPGQTYDAKMIIEVTDMILSDSPSVAAGTAINIDGLTDKASYAGCFGYSLKIFNEG